MPGFEAPLGDYHMAGHPPHIHKAAELLFHIGSDPDNPMDLGAEVEMYMGPELERHVITRTCCIYIPPNFIHSPWRPLKTTRPWIFIEVNQGAEHTEKSFRQLLPIETRERIDWVNRWHDEGYESETRTETKKGARTYRITDRCLKCGICIERCPQGAIVLDQQIREADGLVLNMVHIEQSVCDGCGTCVSEEWWCPGKAIVKA